MEAPPPPPPPSPPGPAGPSIARDLLKVARPLTLVWIILGVVLVLLTLFWALVTLLSLHFPWGSGFDLVYYILWVGIDLVVFQKLEGWLVQWEAGQQSALREAILLWGILALLFGVLPGLLLLAVYAKIAFFPGTPPAGAGPAVVPPPPPARSP